MKWEWPIFLTVTKECKFNIRLNPSKEEDLQSSFYAAEWLDTKDLVKEIPTLKAFLSNETPPPETSKIKKEGFRYNEQDIDEILAGYETDPEGSKPK